MKFDSEEKSYNAYNSYAVAKGFGVRKGPKTKNRNNEIIRCLFLCSCEGQFDKLSPFQERKRQRLEYRFGCLARIKFKISNDMWEVCEFNDVHSHPMIEDNLRHFIQSDRKLTSATKNILDSMVEAENGRKNTYNNFIDQAPAIATAVREVFPENAIGYVNGTSTEMLKRIYPIFIENKDFETTSILSYGDASQN
ncbi:hypothetical protein BC332_29734 [Capsicum chinense]|nr:hypothetical protein BC332_29734 [Capsicum chinense]